MLQCRKILEMLHCSMHIGVIKQQRVFPAPNPKG
jgi:hypothetical protein